MTCEPHLGTGVLPSQAGSSCHPSLCCNLTGSCPGTSNSSGVLELPAPTRNGKRGKTNPPSTPPLPASDYKLASHHKDNSARDHVPV